MGPDGIGPEPGPGNAWLAAHADRLIRSCRHWTGRDLVDPALPPAAAAEALYRAAFVVLAHDNGVAAEANMGADHVKPAHAGGRSHGAGDPRFTYANLAAQRLFEMPWAELVGLPSRYSAEPVAREERQRLLDRVAAAGYIDDYSGVRIARSGRRFRILRATVWNLVDDTGRPCGQAACFGDWETL